MSIDQPFLSLWDMVTSNLLPNALQYAIAVSPIVLAVFLFTIVWDLWVDYVRTSNFVSIKYVTLEIRLPKETFKSPHAMEVFLISLHNTADGTFYAQYWNGETRPWYSLELISVEGQVKFIIWTEDRRKANLISALYSQFPGIEVHEVPDYSKSVVFDPNVYKLWAEEFNLTKEDAWPIKTYMDYGLDKDPKEEFKVDPMLPLLEWLGSVGPNQQAWIQIMIIAHKKNAHKKGTLFGKTDAWKDEAEALKNKIMLRDAKTKVSGEVNPETGYSKLPTLSKGEQEQVAALERSVSKFAFDTGIRAIYVAKKESFNTPFGVGGIIGSMKQFGAEGFNGIRPAGRWIGQFDYPWQDYKNMRRNRQSRLALMAYKRRSYFYTPFPRKPIVLNVEELATMYHFPGSVAATPTLQRLPSKKAEAPSNLPI